VNDPASEIGPSIRRRRQALGLSLDALARQSGVSATMLSEVERSVKNPTVKLAYQIARALGCTLTDLLEADPVRPVRVVRADERRKLVDPDSNVTRYGLASELLGNHLEVAWYALPPGTTSGQLDANRPGVVELVTVLRGELTFELGGERHVLGPGDSITYGPQTTTEYRNDGSEACEILLLGDSSKSVP
jgi:transcriptional regulator with XRE-family HTH domain